MTRAGDLLRWKGIRTGRPMFLLLAVWIGALLLANPRGDFPLGDDWAYARSVRTFVSTGSLHYSPNVEATIFTHILWGSLFVWLSHFSFTVLRASTLALSAGAIVAAWRLATAAGVTPRAATMIAATVAANPIGFMLSNTFMMDVPFEAWSTLSALALCAALRQPRRTTLVLAAGLCGVAVLLRQFGLFLPVMFVPAFLLYHGISRRNIVLSLVPLIATICAIESHQLWMDLAGRRPMNYAHFLNGLGSRSAIDVFKQLLNVGFHASWYLLPMVLWTLMLPETRRGRFWLCWAVTAAVVLVLITGKVAPWGSSVLFDIGVGPPVLRGGDALPSPVPHAPHTVWVVWTIASAVSATLLLIRLLTAGRRLWRERARRSLNASIVVLLGGAFLLSVGAMAVLKFYDRYLLAPTVLMLVVCAMTERMAGRTPLPFARAGAIATLGAMSVFAVLSAHDYFEWNRARWAALTPLVQVGRYSLDEIDGGVEFRGEYSSKSPLQSGRYNADWQVVRDPRVVIAFGDMPGYTHCAAYPYRRWMPPKNDRLVLLVPMGEPCPGR